MRILRYIAWPLGFLFGLLVSLRRTLYELGVWKRKNGAIPSLVVGNISVGGTGKTPMVIWLAQKLADKNPVVLSRGYGRNSKGFRRVQNTVDVAENGDEPTEIMAALAGNIPVYLCEDRLEGLKKIQRENGAAKMAILDDGFQHLPLRADANILLCNYHKPFFKDYPMPAGSLREFAFNARYADVILVTKCPATMDGAEGLQWFGDLAAYGKPVFFATYKTSPARNSSGALLQEQSKVILVSGLVDNAFFAAAADKDYEVLKQFAYPDHYAFSTKDMAHWKSAMTAHGATAILTTRKDFYKMVALDTQLPVYECHSEVEILFDSEDALIALILNKFEPTA